MDLQRQGKRPKVHVKQKGFKNFFTDHSIILTPYPASLRVTSRKMHINVVCHLAICYFDENSNFEVRIPIYNCLLSTPQNQLKTEKIHK